MKTSWFTLILLFFTVLQPSAATQADPQLATLDNLVVGERHITAAQPTAEQLQALAAQGVRAVINLRDDGLPSEPAWSTDVGLPYYHIPISGAEDLTRDKVDLLAQVLQQLGDQPAFLHCSTGQRAASMLALHGYWYEGLSAEAALARARAHGVSSETLLERLQELLNE